MSSSRAPIYEGDTIFLTCSEAQGFVFSHVSSSSYTHVSICPSVYDPEGRLFLPNIHYSAFQILPAYVNFDIDSVEKYLQDERANSAARELVYGRKIKLLHVASNEYLFLSLEQLHTQCATLSFPTKRQVENNPGDIDGYLFKVLPPFNAADTGSTIHYGDEIVLECVSHKGYHVLCVNSSISESYVLKAGISKSVFEINPHICAINSKTKAIKGGSVVRLCNTSMNAYLRAARSNDSKLQIHKDCDMLIKVGARSKQDQKHGIPKELPVSGDSWWQLEKSDNPLDGSSFEFGDKCRLKHVPTQKYLAVTVSDSNNIVLIDGQFARRENFVCDFVIEGKEQLTGEVTKGAAIKFVCNIDEDEEYKRYISIDDSAFEWVTKERKFGSEIYKLQLSPENEHDSFEIDEVKHDDIKQIYYVMSVKSVILKYIKKLNTMPSNGLVLDELLETLEISWKSDPIIQMLRNSDVFDLLVEFLNLPTADKTLCKKVCNVLEAVALLPSNRCRKYLAKSDFLKILYGKLGDDVGVDKVLMALVKNDNDIGKTVAGKLLNYWGSNKLVNAVIIRLMSKICFSTSHRLTGSPDHECYCVQIFKEKQGCFYKTMLEGGKPKYEYDRVIQSLYLLCSIDKSPDSSDFKFLVAQLKLFSYICRSKGQKYNYYKKIILEWVPFEAAHIIFIDPNIHPLAQSAYLDVATATHINEAEIGCSIDDIWHCFLLERLKDGGSKPLEGANVKPNSLNELKESKSITTIFQLFLTKIKIHSSLSVNEKYQNELLYKLLTVTEILVCHGFYWNIQSKPDLDLSDLISMLDGSNDLYNPEDKYEERYKNKSKNMPIFRLKTKILKILREFFKHLIYLAQEQMLYDFWNWTSNSQVATKDFISPPNGLFDDNVIAKLDSKEFILKGSPHERLHSYFTFEHYQYFDYTKNKGKKLVNILQDLMLYEDNTLSASSAALLFDIYNKEDILFRQAQTLFIVEDEKSNMFYELLRYAAYEPDHRHLFYLRQGTGDQSVADFLDEIVDFMMIKQDETQMKSCAQSTAFASLFSNIMSYVLKFSPTKDKSQVYLLRKSCNCLQKMCRGQEKIQEKIFECFTDLLKAKAAVSSIAHLLTETFTNNTTLCRKLEPTSIRQLYTLASTTSDNPEYLEYFVTLQAIMKPHKSGAVPGVLIIYQDMIAKCFLENYMNTFGELMTKGYCAQRIEILERSADTDIELLQLLHLTNLLGTCSDGRQQKFTEDLCQEIFSQKELTMILANPNIPFERKVPFAYVLMEAYFRTEMDPIMSLHQFATDFDFWEHAGTCCQCLHSLPETIQDENEQNNIKSFLRKVFGYHMSYSDMLIVDDKIKRVCFILYYFTKGIGPLIMSFCNELVVYKTDMISRKEYLKIIASCSDALQNIGSTISVFVTGEKKDTFLSSKDQTEFWKQFINSINDVLLDVTAKFNAFLLPPKQNFITCNLPNNRSVSLELSRCVEIEKNKQFQQFVVNYKAVHEWKSNKNEDFEHILPQGPGFESLVELFDDIRFDVNEKDGERYYTIETSKIQSLLTMLQVLFHHLSHQVTSKSREMLNNTLAMTLKVLIGIVHIKMTEEESDDHTSKIKSLQNGLIDMTFPEEAILHLPNPDDKIAINVMSFLGILMLNGNESAQNKIFNIISDDSKFFIRTHRIISKLALHFGYKMKFMVREKRPESIQEQPDPVIEVKPLSRGRSLRKWLSEKKLVTKISSFREDVNIVIINDDALTEQGELEQASHTDESGEDSTNHKVGIALDLVSAMCDGQNRKMQQILRSQQHGVSSCDIVSEIAVLLQTLSEVPVMSNVPIVIKAIQALIEMCAGNFSNQQVALDGQVIESINVILKHSLRSNNGIMMQCKAIELLEVLFEETDENYTFTLKAISKDLKIDHVIGYINNMYEHYKHRHDNDDEIHEIMERNMYRAYHVLRGMADNAGVPFNDYVDLSKEDIESEVWNLLNRNTYSIEVNYVAKNKKELLTRVYFPFDSSRELSEDEKYLLQTNINRDTPEDKVKDLLDWTESVWKKDKHKRRLNQYKILNILFFQPRIRYGLLVFLTILLNLLVLIFFRIPKFVPNCNSPNRSEPLIFPWPQVCWESYQFVLMYLFGIPHLILSTWWVITYFITEAPNFIFEIPFIHLTLYNYIQRHPRISSWLSRRFGGKFLDTLKTVPKSRCFDIYFLSINPIGTIFFLLSSLLGLIIYGYFYCFCLLYMLVSVDVIQHVLNAVIGKAKQLIFVSLLILSLLLVYAVLSFAFMSSFFFKGESLYCENLFQCFITVTREGLIDTFGENIPVVYGDNDENANFEIYLWRSFFDVTFFIIITIIALNVITAILVDRFSELRAKRDAALQDQKDVCFVCGIANDRFEREGLGFRHHYKEEHNVYNLIYYALYIKSKCPQDYNAIEKYVNDMMDKKSITFYPLRKAKVFSYMS